jgi:cysteine synthase A
MEKDRDPVPTWDGKQPERTLRLYLRALRFWRKDTAVPFERHGTKLYKSLALNSELRAAVDLLEEEVITGPHPVTGDWLDARIERVQQILARTPGAFWTDQYTNPANAEAHQHGTAAEIAADLGRAPDFIFAAASTCGTLGGLTRWAQATGAHTRIIAVDVHGSRLFGGPPAPRRVPGIGSSRAPDLLDTSRIEVQMVSDGDCVAGCRHLLQAEALLGGGSAGALVAAAARVLPSAPPGADAVLVLMDRGERYLDTVYDEGWVREAVGEVPELDV